LDRFEIYKLDGWLADGEKEAFPGIETRIRDLNAYCERLLRAMDARMVEGAVPYARSGVVSREQMTELLKVIERALRQVEGRDLSTTGRRLPYIPPSRGGGRGR
jgi:hypothetical protein